MQLSAVLRSTLQNGAAQYSTVQYVVQYSMLDFAPISLAMCGPVQYCAVQHRVRVDDGVVVIVVVVDLRSLVAGL